MTEILTRLSPSEDERPIEARIRESLDRLPPSERKVAEVILDLSGQLASYSATELADLADVSKAAVTRFFRRLGYTDFNQARQTARHELLAGSPLSLAKPGEAPRNLSRELSAILARDTDNLQRTIEALRPDTLAAVADALATGSRLWIVGFRNSYALALYVCLQLRTLRDDVHLLPGRAESPAERLASFQASDAMLAVGFRRRVPMLARIMRVAREVGMPIVLVTDPAAVEPTKLATWTLRCYIRGQSMLDSYGAAMSVLCGLAASVAARLGDEGQERLRRVERLHEQLEDLGEG